MADERLEVIKSINDKVRELRVYPWVDTDRIIRGIKMLLDYQADSKLSDVASLSELKEINYMFNSLSNYAKQKTQDAQVGCTENT